MYIFGSHLIKKIFPDFHTPNDTDWVTNDISELKESSRENEYYYIPCTPNREMTADEIYTIKVSHAIYDIKWSKTMSDIRFLQNRGCKVDMDFLKKLREHWLGVHLNKNKRANFDILEDKFFSDNVKRKIPHDDLHKVFNPIPSYKLVVDGVKPNENKFINLNEKQKIDIAIEEACVIAIERYFPNMDYRMAYHTAQKDLVTRLHPIWLADYVILNWNKYFWTIKTNFYEIYERTIN